MIHYFEKVSVSSDDPRDLLLKFKENVCRVQLDNRGTKTEPQSMLKGKRHKQTNASYEIPEKHVNDTWSEINSTRNEAREEWLLPEQSLQG